MSLAPSDPPQPALESLVAGAQRGDDQSLERLVRAIHDQVFRLALRMTACPADAEDATQDILIRVITRLSTYRGDAAFSTWVHRVAVNHLLDRAKSPGERMGLTFDRFAADLLAGLAAGPTSDPDAGLLEREVQLACTHALLVCLDREHRIAYILGDIFGISSDDGAYICDVPPATYRKRLSRARGRVQGHLSRHCGIVNDAAPCRCSKRVDVAVRTGRISRRHIQFATPVPADGADRSPAMDLDAANAQIIHMHDAASLLRLLPAAVSASSRRNISALLDESGLV